MANESNDEMLFAESCIQVFDENSLTKAVSDQLALQSNGISSKSAGVSLVEQFASLDKNSSQTFCKENAREMNHDSEKQSRNSPKCTVMSERDSNRYCSQSESRGIRRS